MTTQGNKMFKVGDSVWEYTRRSYPPIRKGMITYVVPCSWNHNEAYCYVVEFPSIAHDVEEMCYPHWLYGSLEELKADVLNGFDKEIGEAEKKIAELTEEREEFLTKLEKTK